MRVGEIVLDISEYCAFTIHCGYIERQRAVVDAISGVEYQRNKQLHENSLFCGERQVLLWTPRSAHPLPWSNKDEGTKWHSGC